MTSYKTAKAKKPYTDGNFIKEVCQDILSCYGKEGDHISDMIKQIPMSRSTVTRRISDIGTYVTKGLNSSLLACKYFSLALDESTDISDISQLVIFVRCVDKNYEITEEILKLHSFHGTTKGIDIFNAVANAV